MAITVDNSANAPPGRGVMGWLKTIVARFTNRGDLSGLDRSEFEQVARDLNLSRYELQRLSGGNGSSPALLHQRMADFDLAPEALTRQHPEVMRDLQRVCGMCDATKRCANEFARNAPASSRSDYCPNTQTLQALERENILSSAQTSLPIGPSCC
ncbi:MAG: hypothetical protein PS018_29045 [bacterium]|nr:hypothetical protein [bacterium]